MAYQSKYTGLEIDDILDSVEWKQGKIEDLASIRAGAQKGATALQSYTEKYTGTVTGIKLNGVVKSGSGVIDLGTISTTETDPIFSASPAASITEAKKVEWDNKVDKVNGKQLSTEDFTTALKTKLEGLNNYDDTELSEAIETLRGDFDEIVSGDTTTAIKTFNEVIAFLDGLTDTQDLESIIANIEQQIAGKMDKVTLATVATSGSYNDLSNKPTIPSAVTESTVSGWGFTKNAGTYSKPSTGIPKTDLASAVQTSLGKADTAVQPAAISDFIKGVAINGTTIANTSGTVYLPNASTGGYGVTRLNSNINSTSTMEAATPSAVKAAYDLANGKQDKLVSGTNIKTINGTSILGSGNIEISGGGSSGGEDIRYFTEFTMEQVVAAGGHLPLSNGASELYTAAENNKLICIPCQDGLNGFIVASYEVTLDEELYVSFIYGNVYYRMLVMPIALDISIQPLLTQTVFVDSGSIDVYDNTNYVVTAPVTSVHITIMVKLNVGSTIRFTTGEDCYLRITGNSIWANGVIPTIESGVTYELSIIKQSIAGSNKALAVLTPFKSVE